MCMGGWERNVDRRLRRRAAQRTFLALLSSTQSPDRTRPQVGTVNGSQHFISFASLALLGPASCSALPCSGTDHTGLGDILGFCSLSPSSGLSVPAVHCTI